MGEHAMLGGPAIKVENLCKHFGDTVAVDDISFEAQPGQILGILGANGAGKSTTIQMLLGLTKPASGSIEILGKNLTQNRISLLSQMNFASAYASLPGNLTVHQNLKTFARIYSVPNYTKRITELLETFEVSHLEHAVTGHLSSGQNTRISLCKALLNRPKLLLLDEPTASLDPDIADKVRHQLKEIQAQTGMTILYTSHNMRDIEEICHQVLFMHQGRVRALNTPKALLEQFGETSMEGVFIQIARSENPVVVKP